MTAFNKLITKPTHSNEKSILNSFKTIFLLGFFIINILSPYFSLISFEKKYSYSEESSKIKVGNIETIYENEASLYRLPNKVSKYIKKGELTFNKPKDLVIFKFDKTKYDVSDIKVTVSNGDKKLVANIDDDGDERTILDEFAYSEPILVNQSGKISFQVESKNRLALEQNMEVTGVDTINYKENLVWKTDSINAEEIGIVKRADWGADETLRYEDNPRWVAIYKQQAIDALKPKTAWQLSQEKKIVDIRAYLAKNFPLEDTPVSTVRSENGHSLVWNIEKTKLVNKIIIHHTAESLNSDSRDDNAVMRAMYAYHTFTRGWGDIGYNYVIGRDGKIYEGRAGGDYVVAAHDLRNNKSTVGISVMGNFQTTKINDTQKNGTDGAIGFIAKKFGIDLNKKSIAHKECAATKACLINDIEVWNLSGHRDSGATACPGDNLYALLGDFRNNGQLYSSGLTYILNNGVINTGANLPKGPNIKIKLSFTGVTVDIKSYTNENMKIQVGSRSGYTRFSYLRFEPRGTDNIALIVGNKSLKVPSFKITSTVLEVSNWSRKPSWDKSGLVNDNKFRGSITVANEGGKLILINELPLEDYLKGIAEISNDENEQKAKTILVAARSYALWYTNPNNRKFPGKPYDGSDNPDEFQKYLGYSFEMRGNNISKYIDDTNLQVIMYNGKLIKPWYFNQSNGNTKSYKQYCEQRKIEGSFPKTMACEDTPYLQSVVDPAGSTEGFKGHGVGISGAGAKYFAEYEGKKYDEIIKYFLKGVTVEKTSY